MTERARWWWGTAPSEIRGESTKQYSRQTPVFVGGRCSRTSGWTPDARSRICACRASFLMTFVQSGMPPRLPAHDQCIGVAVHHDGLEPRLAQGEAGVHAAVVELDALA